MLMLFTTFAHAWKIVGPTFPQSNYTLQEGTFHLYKTDAGAVRYQDIIMSTVCKAMEPKIKLSTKYKPTYTLYKNYLSPTKRLYRYRVSFEEECNPPVPVTPVVTAPSVTWTQCAIENQQCNFVGTKKVRYGANGIYVSKIFTNGVNCSNSVFTDPAVGVAKRCDISSEAVTQAPTPTADEEQPVTTVPVTTQDRIPPPPKVAVGCNGNMEQCVIPAGITAKVWFGVATKWTVKENVTGSIGCNANVMGDPKSGAYNRCFYVDNRLLAKNLDPKGQNLMPAVNLTLVPKGSVGFSGPMIKPAATPKAETFPYAGAFRISCEYSHMNNDDPIVFPGVPNATHHHTFFGNTGINAFSTNETLHTSGNSTCAGGILNRSGYWMPSLINTATGAPQKPSVIVVYYKAADEKNGAYIKAPPPGLKMLAGNPKPLAVADAQGGFFCQDQTQVMNPANWGILWQGNHIKQSCGGPNQMLRMIVSFPQCWDGKNLDSPDHKSHMAFSCGDECENAQGIVTKSANSCPASHPIAIPSIAINADFYGLDPNATYRLASDNYPTAYPGGYSLHADWMNGWDETTMNRMVKNCLNNPKNCGGPNLGDGYTLYGVNQD